MADSNEDFSVLSDMVDEAKSYGSIATFGKPSLDSESLSSLVSSSKCNSREVQHT